MTHHHCINLYLDLSQSDKGTIQNLLRDLCSRYIYDLYLWLERLYDLSIRFNSENACISDCINYFRPSGPVSLLYEDMSCLSDCPTTTTTTTKTISSPNSPSKFPDWIFAFYYMSAPAGKTVDIEFSAFNFPNCYRCHCSGILILDRDGEELLSRNNGCGTEIPDRVTFTDEATLFFFSDSNANKWKGFSAVLSEFVAVQITILNRSKWTRRNSFSTPLKSDLGKV